MSKCQCSFRVSMVGDGCRYCQPQEYIDRLHEQTEDDSKEIELLRGQRDQLLEALQHIAEYWNRDQNEFAMADALWHIINEAESAIAAVEASK